MDALLLLARLLLALVFIVSGVAKLMDRAGSQQTFIDFGVPAKLTAPSAILLPLAELAVAGALIPVMSAWWGAIGTIALLLLFIAGIGYNLARGRTPDCHCFGQIHAAPIGWPTLVRNLILAAVAGCIVWFGRTNAGMSTIGWLGTLAIVQRMEVSVGMLVVALLVLETWIVVRVLQQHGEILLRLNEVETKLAESITNVVAEVVLPTTNGLPVGTVAPAFGLSGLYRGDDHAGFPTRQPEVRSADLLGPRVWSLQRPFAGDRPLAA
jgi:hypothetical protein